MPSPCPPADGVLRRHDLVLPSPPAWHAAVAAEPDLATDGLVSRWVERGWPLVARRRTRCDAAGVPLGLPLPPSHGKRRLAFVVGWDDVVATAPPPLLRAAIDVAPPPWRPTLRRLVELAAAFGVDARVYGSLAWHLLTGLGYVTSRSDLDLLLPLPRPGDVPRLTAALAAIERDAPMRFDGELVRDDGAAVHWRELHDGVREVLVKTSGDAMLVAADRFLADGIRREAHA
jgi:phosphoribosyl-dephospho-CoA transferase